jgi:esterase
MKLFFRKTGEGDPLIILHGLYGSSDNWMGIARKLSSRFTVWCMDHRNHGHSPHDQVHSYEAMKDDLAGFMDDHITGKATLLGHSMGGKVAMLYAAGYPERIKNLIIADIAPRDYMISGDESQYHLHRNILLALQELAGKTFSGRKMIEDQLSEKIGDGRIIQLLMKNVVWDPVSHHIYNRLNAESLFDNLEEIIGGVNPRWFEDRIPISAYPVTFIRGLESQYITDPDIAAIKSIYPEAEIVDIPGAGHWLHVEQPELFLDAVFAALSTKSLEQ